MNYVIDIGKAGAVYNKKGNPKAMSVAILIDPAAISWGIREYTGIDVDLNAYYKKIHKKPDSAGQVSEGPLRRDLRYEVEILELCKDPQKPNSYTGIYKIKEKNDGYGIAILETVPGKDKHFVLRMKVPVY